MAMRFVVDVYAIGFDNVAMLSPVRRRHGDFPSAY